MHSSSRNGAKVVWLAVHTTEGIMRAKDLRDWKSWAGSSHAANDETGVLMTPADGFVPYNLAAWTLRNGNAISDNIEQCGWARWTRAEWFARPKLLDTTAMWLADRSRARGIPLRLLTPDQIRRREPGVLGHGHYSTATGDGTHWDPGPNYPWDVVLSKANWLLNPTDIATATQQQEDDMGHVDSMSDAVMDRLAERVMRRPDPDGRGIPILHLQAIAGGVTALLGRQGVDIDEAQIARELAPLLKVQVASLSQADLDGIARAVADEQARRLTST